MIRSLRYLFLLLFIGVSSTAFAQNAPGEIVGKVLDEKKQPIIGAIVQVFDGGIAKGGAQTDYDGNYSVKPIDPGRYDVKVSYTGYSVSLTTGVIVSPDKTTGVNVSMAVSSTELGAVTVIAKSYSAPLVDRYNGGGRVTLTAKEIERLPTRQTNDFAAQAPGVYQLQSGGGLSMSGGRGDGNITIIDGVVVTGTPNLPQGSIDQMEVMTGGIPAKYGDASGGVINITTKGVASDITGGVTLQHSVDGYNNNLVSANLSGPVYKKKDANGEKKPVMGFLLGGDFYYDNNRFPTYEKTYVANDDVLANLTQNPLRVTSDASGNQVYKYATEYVRQSQLKQVSIPPNDKTIEGRLNGKLDYQLAENINVTVGGNFNYTRQDQYSRQAALFAPSSIPTQTNYSGRGFVRFTQRFGKSASATESKSGTISNAYYTVQADYQKNYAIRQDPTFKKDIFNYSYIGKFDQQYMPIYQPNSLDSATNKTGVRLISNYQPTTLNYQRAELNPELANYTTQYYNSANTPPQTLLQLESNQGLGNGDLPFATYGYFSNVGTGLSGYGLSSQDQYSVAVDASFDLQLGKMRHSIGFGLYYQQRIEKNYFANSNLQGQGTQSLWGLMRNLTSTNNFVLDASNPIFVVGGKKYSVTDVNTNVVLPGPADTILYNYKRLGAQSPFDRNLRTKLGLDPNGTDYINVDGMDPSTFSLNMFSADELLNSGNSYVGYQGYTYYGTKQSGNVNFNDFWTQKDANGNFTRPIGSFQPNYVAGYILDKFQYKDVNFNIGVRIDRFDANTSVLKDPYSFYAVKTVSDVSGANNSINGGQHPANIGSNYVVYVDNNASNKDANNNASVVGYRNGDNWYDATGRLIDDPNSLKVYTGGRDPQPYLVDPTQKITDSSFDPKASFTSYKPQVNVMPRLAFSFPISDAATFFAHYDIYVQRPTSNVFTSPNDYFTINSNANQLINNPDLKPQKTFDYEVGFQQKVTDQSSITLTAYYKERKDFITVRPYLFAWPVTYYTYGNRDFTTTKGLTLRYDLRRISHLQTTIGYTLQFAEGTGSTPNGNNSGSTTQVSSGGLLQNFIQAGLPNLRYVNSLSVDSRHSLNVSMDYRFFENEGPIVGGKHIFQNAGLNLLFKARSGEPYTLYQEPEVISRTVKGSLNGARYPWHYGIDAKLDKDFYLSFHKQPEPESGIKPKRPLVVNLFVIAQNLFNIRDILFVYGYTSRPDDNGYLTHPTGIALTAQQTDPASYVDLYRLYYNNPSDYNRPRQLAVGATFNF